eukprot:2961169-Rhodomonas_salina.1
MPFSTGHRLASLQAGTTLPVDPHVSHRWPGTIARLVSTEHRRVRTYGATLRGGTLCGQTAGTGSTIRTRSVQGRVTLGQYRTSRNERLVSGRSVADVSTARRLASAQHDRVCVLPPSVPEPMSVRRRLRGAATC